MSIDGFGEVAEHLRRSTVLIQAGDRGNGSGVIWGGGGLIVTNAHVARGSHTRVQLWDGREFEARVTSRDPQLDLAALRIRANDLPAVKSGDSSKLRPGELAIAIGNRSYSRGWPAARLRLADLGAGQRSARSW